MSTNLKHRRERKSSNCEEQFAGVLDEMRTQKEFFRQVIDLNPSFIFAKDREGKFTLVNKALADAYGAEVDDLIGKSDGDFNDNEIEVEHFRSDDLEVINSQEKKFIPEEVITDSEGNVRYLQTVKIPVVEKSGVAHMLSLIHISEPTRPY